MKTDTKKKAMAIATAVLIALTGAISPAYAEPADTQTTLAEIRETIQSLSQTWEDGTFENLVALLASDVKSALTDQQILSLVEAYNSLMDVLATKGEVKMYYEALSMSLEYSLTDGKPGHTDIINIPVVLMIPEILGSNGSSSATEIAKTLRIEKINDAKSACLKVHELISNEGSSEKYKTFMETLELAGTQLGLALGSGEAPSLTPSTETGKLSIDDVGEVVVDGTAGGSIHKDTAGTHSGGNFQMGSFNPSIIDPEKEQSYVLVRFAKDPGSEFQKVGAITEDDKVGFSDIKQIVAAIAHYANSEGISFYYLDDDIRYMFSYQGKLFVREYVDVVMTYEETVSYFESFNLVNVKFEKI